MFQEFIQHLLLVGAEAESSASAAASPDWWGVLAGLHPVLTHFPIALIIVAAGVEFVGLLMRREKVASFTVIALVIGGGAAMFSAWSGWSLADAGYGRGWQLELHRWLGVAAGLLGLALSILVLFAWFGSRHWATSIVRALTFVCAILIGVAAHFGGELVWGESLVLESLFPEPGARPLSVSDHVSPNEDATTTTPAPAKRTPSSPKPVEVPAVPEAPKAEAPVTESTLTIEGERPAKVAMVSFSDQIEPILDLHCWKCHGPTGRARAGLRLVSEADFDRILDEHPVVAAGAPERSELFDVITLPRDDDDAMPPSGPGLSDEEIALVRLWIIQGGSTESGTTSSATDSVIAPAPAAEVQPPPVADEEVSTPETRAMEAASKRLSARGVPVRPLSRDSNLLELNASSLSHRIDPPFGDADLDSITALSPALAGLDLSHTEVTDAGIRLLVGFDVLRTLALKGTAVSGDSAGVLAGLAGLERLNLFETQMDDAGLRRLAASSSLQRIFVGSSRVTDAGVKAAREVNPNLQILRSISTPSGE